MAESSLIEEVETAQSAYDTCSEELATALNEVKTNGRRTKDQLQRIAAINKRCDELMQIYLAALRKYTESGTDGVV